ncbi:MAG: hypothetical protein GY834_06335, partial [Bacteroidetes bacterium]|nr:hypothetical protein [Bacteroidota bacterium]
LDYSHIYTLEQDMTQAINIIQQGIKLQEKNANLLFRLASYLIKNGQIIEGYLSFEMGLQLDFQKHKLVFDYHPHLLTDPNLIQIIEDFKEKK